MERIRVLLRLVSLFIVVCNDVAVECHNEVEQISSFNMNNIALFFKEKLRDMDRDKDMNKNRDKDMNKNRDKDRNRNKDNGDTRSSEPLWIRFKKLIKMGSELKIHYNFIMFGAIAWLFFCILCFTNSNMWSLILVGFGVFLLGIFLSVLPALVNMIYHKEAVQNLRLWFYNLFTFLQQGDSTGSNDELRFPR